MGRQNSRRSKNYNSRAETETLYCKGFQGRLNKKCSETDSFVFDSVQLLSSKLKVGGRRLLGLCSFKALKTFKVFQAVRALAYAVVFKLKIKNR